MAKDMKNETVGMKTLCTASDSEIARSLVMTPLESKVRASVWQMHKTHQIFLHHAMTLRGPSSDATEISIRVKDIEV